MTAFTAIDLSGLPAPNVVESLAYETILAEMIADLVSKDSFFTAMVESDPVYKILEVAAYREFLLRQRVNDAARSVMLPYAEGADLDNLASYYGVQRLVLDPGDLTGIPPIPPTLESDVDLRRRTQLALEGFTTAGSEGSYIFHGLSAHPQVKDIGVESPDPGDVVVTVLSRVGTGVPTSDILDAVESALNAKDIRPLTDNVTVSAATIETYTIEAILHLYLGPSADVVLEAALARLTKYVQSQHKIGLRVPLSGIYAALQVEGVERVELITPVADIVPSSAEAAFCTGFDVTTQVA
jgi:phage-related baseplate assembly protein